MLLAFVSMLHLCHDLMRVSHVISQPPGCALDIDPAHVRPSACGTRHSRTALMHQCGPVMVVPNIIASRSHVKACTRLLPVITSCVRRAMQQRVHPQFRLFAAPSGGSSTAVGIKLRPSWVNPAGKWFSPLMQNMASAAPLASSTSDLRNAGGSLSCIASVAESRGRSHMTYSMQTVHATC